jgi:hypothetical protein
MSLSLWAHISLIVIILWNILLLAGMEHAEVKSHVIRNIARTIVIIVLLGLVLVWEALP